MKITMVNEAGNCFRIAETKEKVFELERLGFKKYEEPKPIIVSKKETAKQKTNKKPKEPKPIIVSKKETAKQKTNKKPKEPKPVIVSEKETAKQKTNKKPTTKKAIKKNG